MILPGGPLRVYVATRPVDFRKGMDGLAAVAQAHLRFDPFSGAVLVFRAKRADRVKILVWDGSGILLTRRPSPTSMPRVAARRMRPSTSKASGGVCP
jgi:transposase